MKKNVWIIIIVLLSVVAMGVTVFFLAGCGSSNKTSKSQVHEQGETVRRPDGTAKKGTDATEISAPQWLELPSVTGQESRNIRTHYARMEGREQRNYTMLYDPQTYTSYWVAYPLCHSHMTSGREEIWAYDPSVSRSEQTSVARGYGASQPTENYPKNFYARGHQLPNADRNAVPQMQEQTYYSTNITPQLQNGFNAGIWKQLEEAVRNNVPQGDTLYIVTGASFAKVGETSTSRQIVNKNDGKSLPVPNYYWKVLLKVRRDDNGVAEAATIGFWLPHDDLKGHDYEDYAVSVDQIEAWTGYDMFVNLTDRMENQAESCSDWDAFRMF